MKIKLLSVLFAVILLAVAFSGCTEENKNIQQPVASFTYSPPSFDFNTTGFTDTILFSGNYTDEGKISSWYWDFGDGNTSNERNPVHTFEPMDFVATYNVTLTVTNLDGITSSATDSVHVPYLISFGYVNLTYEPNVNITTEDTIMFNATINDYWAYRTGLCYWYGFYWDFGDGTGFYTHNITEYYKENHTSLRGGKETNYTLYFMVLKPSHRYNTTGNYTVRIYVTRSNDCDNIPPDSETKYYPWGYMTSDSIYAFSENEIVIK